MNKQGTSFKSHLKILLFPLLDIPVSCCRVWKMHDWRELSFVSSFFFYFFFFGWDSYKWFFYWSIHLEERLHSLDKLLFHEWIIVFHNSPTGHPSPPWGSSTLHPVSIFHSCLLTLPLDSITLLEGENGCQTGLVLRLNALSPVELSHKGTQFIGELWTKKPSHFMFLTIFFLNTEVKTIPCNTILSVKHIWYTVSFKALKRWCIDYKHPPGGKLNSPLSVSRCPYCFITLLQKLI